MSTHDRVSAVRLKRYRLDESGLLTISNPDGKRVSPGTVGQRLSLALLHALARWCLARFEDRTVTANAINRKTLTAILRRHRQTKFGRRHNFARLAMQSELVTQYRRTVPLSTYADYERDIERIAAGEPAILTADPVTSLSRTAGTTGRSKRIPRTRRVQGHAVRLITLAALAVLDRDVPRMRDRRRGINLMSLVAPPTPAPGQVPEISGPNAGLRRLRAQIPRLFTSPVTAFEIAHQPTAFYLHALFGLRARDALFIETTFASHLMGFLDVIEQRADDLISDLAHGTLAADLVLTAAEREGLAPHIQPDPSRAAEVAAVVAGGPGGIIPRLWPAMACIKAITTGSFAASLPRLRWLAGPDLPIHSGAYTASEGIIGLNLRVGGDAHYVLAVGTAFFEFIPAAQAEEANPPTLTLDELQVGGDYEIVLTTDAGLYRYRLGDVVQITGHHGEAPTFAYRYRRGMLLNLANEKTTEWHAGQALRACVTAWLGTPHALREWIVAGEMENGRGWYTFYVELAPSAATWAGLDWAAAELDRALAAANEFYAHNGRESGRLLAPRLAVVQPGTFQSLASLQATQAGGVAPTQVKVRLVLQDSASIAVLKQAVIASSDLVGTHVHAAQITGPGIAAPGIEG